MNKMNMKKYINLLVLALTGIVMYSCSGEENISATDETGQETTLSVLLDASQDDLVKSSGNPDIDAEKKIYIKHLNVVHLNVVIYSVLRQHAIGLKR